jgi:hypothetical protein
VGRPEDRLPETLHRAESPAPFTSGGHGVVRDYCRDNKDPEAPIFSGHVRHRRRLIKSFLLSSSDFRMIADDVGQVTRPSHCVDRTSRRKRRRQQTVRRDSCQPSAIKDRLPTCPTVKAPHG